jgi:hypothetical protein
MIFNKFNNLLLLSVLSVKLGREIVKSIRQAQLFCSEWILLLVDWNYITWNSLGTFNLSEKIMGIVPTTIILV